MAGNCADVLKMPAFVATKTVCPDFLLKSTWFSAGKCPNMVKKIPALVATKAVQHLVKKYLVFSWKVSVKVVSCHHQSLFLMRKVSQLIYMQRESNVKTTDR